MWNRNKKEDDIQYRPSSPAPSASEQSREAIPVSAYPTRQTEYGSARVTASIGKSLVINGHIQGKEDLVIDGRLEGNVDLPENRLTVGATGHVQGGIRAREIVVVGTVQGNMEASERVEIKKGARVIGDLKAQRPVIEDEAYFKGNVETIRVDTPKPAPKPQQPAPPIVDAQAAPETKPEIKRG
ncbi:MAG: polymer-forming cytoskeletal protein [Acidobacteria bacterium]|nr:polymer-forming cytoskeletal protein [Acidobacteriota bacterium]